MLREYITAHLRKDILNHRYISDTVILGYVSGKKRAKIPWAQLSDKPNLWIKPECMPNGFTWADPSKIRIGDIFLLLEHWRERTRQHLTPLIWATTCPLIDVSLSSEERQVYDSDNTPCDRSSNDDRTEDRPNVCDPSLISDHSLFYHTSQSNLSHSDAQDSDNPGAMSDVQEDSRTVGTPFSDSGAGSTWGGLDEDMHMSPPPLRRTYLPQEDLSKCDQLFYSTV